MSRRVCAVLAAVAACALLCGGVASGAGIIKHNNTTSSRRDRKPQRYYVLQVLGASGEVSFEVASDLEVKERLNDYEEEYKKAGMEWMKSKREAQKNKQDFTEAPPKGPKLMQKMSSTFKKEEEALAYAEKIQKQWDEAVEKRAARKAEGEAKAEDTKVEDKKVEAE